jgi:hypothetical protein
MTISKGFAALAALASLAVWTDVAGAAAPVRHHHRAHYARHKMPAPVAHRDIRPVEPQDYYAGAPGYGYPYGVPLDRYGQPLLSDQALYGYSGTRGRMGLGADSRHPEGPGNVVAPSLR